MSSIKIGWRRWIGERVKIIDEYNRIPTKTQSALLSLLAEGYAEMYDQYVYAGKSAWFLTANDDAGGGTFQVIDALKDRIDIIVRAVPFNSGYVDTLLGRVEKDAQPEDVLPEEVVFEEGELEEIYQEILGVEVPAGVVGRMSYFLGQLDFCRMASPQFECMNKDTLRLAGQTVGSVCDEQCPLDKKVHLCSQTENGVSVRVYQTVLHYAKALAYVRGNGEVALEDVRQLLPWILHEKLIPNARSLYFDGKGKRRLLQDRVTWIRTMFDTAMEQHGRHASTRDKVVSLRGELDSGLGGLDARGVSKRLSKVSGMISSLMKKAELSGPIYEDLIHLKAIHGRYVSYLQWLRRDK